MQVLRQAGSDPAFLLKAMREASGELRGVLEGMPHRMLLKPGTGNDDDWCLLAIAYHMHDTESGFLRQIETIMTIPESEMRHVDFDDIPLREDYADEDEDELLENFHYLRRRNAYMLWDISDREWQLGAIHPYRGRMTLMELIREIYRHDLEHLWQARRIADHVQATRR